MFGDTPIFIKNLFGQSFASPAERDGQQKNLTNRYRIICRPYILKEKTETRSVPLKLEGFPIKFPGPGKMEKKNSASLLLVMLPWPPQFSVVKPTWNYFVFFTKIRKTKLREKKF